MAERPRILILSAFYFPLQGGSETHARELAVFLSRSGFRVTIVTRRVDGATASLEMIDDIPVHRVGLGGPRTGIRKWLMIPFAFLKMLRLRDEFDLIYCPGYQGIGMAAIAAGRWLRRPVILRSGNLGVLYGNNWNAPLGRWHINPNGRFVKWLKTRFRKIYMRADGFAANCRDIEIEALECQVPRSRVHYLPNAVDLERFRPARDGERAQIRAEEHWPDDVCIVLYVGRLSVEKGVLDLLEAWRSVRRPNTRLVLVGPDMTGNAMDAGPAAREFVQQNKLQDVAFYGESRNVARLLRGADVYVQPSHYEAFSNAVIEAMASRLPVVASKVGGMLDCIVDHENGLFAAPRSPSDLARQIETLFDDAELGARLAENAHRTVVDEFDQVKIFGKFADLFEATVAGSDRGQTTGLTPV